MVITSSTQKSYKGQGKDKLMNSINSTVHLNWQNSDYLMAPFLSPKLSTNSNQNYCHFTTYITLLKSLELEWLNKQLVILTWFPHLWSPALESWLSHSGLAGSSLACNLGTLVQNVALFFPWPDFLEILPSTFRYTLWYIGSRGGYKNVNLFYYNELWNKQANRAAQDYPSKTENG